MCVLGARGLPPAELGRALIEDVRRFAGGGLHADDVTLVVVRRA